MSADRTILADHYRGGTGSPLVLVHGITATWKVWGEMIPALEEHHDVFAPTLDGHARGTEWGEGGATLIDLADRLERQLDIAGIEQAHFAGNSLGGWLTLEMCKRGRALSGVAFCPAGAWQDRKDIAKVTGMIGQSVWAAQNVGPHIQNLMRRPGFRKLALGTVAVHGDRAKSGDAIDALNDSAMCEMFKPFTEWAKGDAEQFEMAECEMPVLLAWSDTDKLLPAETFGAAMRENVPCAEWVTLPDCGHVPMIDDPALCVRTILGVTNKVDAGTPAAS